MTHQQNIWRVSSKNFCVGLKIIKLPPVLYHRTIPWPISTPKFDPIILYFLVKRYHPLKQILMVLIDNWMWRKQSENNVQHFHSILHSVFLFSKFFSSSRFSIRRRWSKKFTKEPNSVSEQSVQKFQEDREVRSGYSMSAKKISVSCSTFCYFFQFPAHLHLFSICRNIGKKLESYSMFLFPFLSCSFAHKKKELKKQKRAYIYMCDGKGDVPFLFSLFLYLQ